MKLINAHYHGKGRPHKYLLLLYLGVKPGRTCGLLSELIPTKERSLILNNKLDLVNMDIESIIVWLKKNAPMSYKTGYREIHNNNITIVQEYEI